MSCYGHPISSWSLVLCWRYPVIFVVDRFPRPMEGNGVTQNFSSTTGSGSRWNTYLLCLFHIYYRFIFRFPIGLDFLFLTFSISSCHGHLLCRSQVLTCCCCLPTPMTFASEGSPIFPFVVHQLASLSIWPAVHSPRRGLSTNPGVTMWCVCGCN